MAWITIDPATVPLSAAEIAKVDSVVGSAKLPAIILRVATKVQGYVASRNAIGDPGTIPDELESEAMALIVEAYLNQVPAGKLLLTEERQTAAKDARSALRDAARGLIKIVSPVAPAPLQAGPQMETIERGNRGDDREDLHRL